MAGRAVCGGRFFNPHPRMAPNALLVIGRYQARANRLPFNERLAVTAAALGWFFSDYAVVVTPLAESSRFTVISDGKLAVLDFFLKRLDDFTVGHPRLLELIRQNLDVHYFRNLIHGVGCGRFFPGFQHKGRQFVRLLHRRIDQRHGFHMAGQAGAGVFIAGKLLIDILVTTRTFRLRFLVVVAANTTLGGIRLVH